MINILELTGAKLKKDIELFKVFKRYHNHNNTGGNFAFNLYTGNPINYFKGNGEKHYEISGVHDQQGNIRILRLGGLYDPGVTIFNNTSYLNWDYNRLIQLIKRVKLNGDRAIDQINLGGCNNE